MYRQHWGLNRSPFTTAGKRFFQSATQQEAVARIEYLSSANRRLGLLAGEEGVGKTTVLEFICRKARRTGAMAIYINLLGIDEQEFVFSLAEEFGSPMDPSARPVVAWRKIFDAFTTHRYQGQDTLILLDDAHEADTEVLAAVSRMVQWKPSEDSGVTTILATSNDRRELVGRRMLELCDLCIEVTPWEIEDTVSFLRGSLEAAGAQSEIFNDSAIEVIHRLSRGVPRRISQLAELALVAGAGAEMETLDRETIVAVQDELRMPLEVTVSGI